jgi:hypothetical protein
MYSFLTRSNQSLQGNLSVAGFGRTYPKSNCCNTLTQSLPSFAGGSLFFKALSGKPYRWLA